MQSCRPREGIDSIPGGADFYQHCLKWHTSLDITPHQVHELGLAEMTRIQKEMERVSRFCYIACKQYYTNVPIECTRTLLSSAVFYKLMFKVKVCKTSLF